MASFLSKLAFRKICILDSRRSFKKTSGEKLIVVEGFFDEVWQTGFKNVVALYWL
jgi:hypothetical protein